LQAHFSTLSAAFRRNDLALGIAWITIDSRDPDSLADFWVRALDYEVEYKSPPEEEEEREVALRPRDGRGNYLLFLSVPDAKVVKNRLHLDLRPEDQSAEVERLLGLGATHADIGQGDVSWVVMADPEGNEFCILRTLKPGEEGP
jgi:hypothetical protein